MQIMASPEFKTVKKVAKKNVQMVVSHIENGNLHLAKHAKRIKELRNAFGGHVQQTAIDFAARSFAPNEMGKVTWISPDSQPTGLLSLELHYAQNIVAGAIGSLAQGGVGVEVELREAIAVIMGSYPMMQGATYGLVHLFLWPKFGR